MKLFNEDKIYQILMDVYRKDKWMHKKSSDVKAQVWDFIQCVRTELSKENQPKESKQ